MQKQDGFTTLWEFYITVLSVGDETMQVYKTINGMKRLWDDFCTLNE